MLHLEPGLPTDIQNLLKGLADTAKLGGYSLFLVGGSVRDRLMDRPVHDLDLTTDAPVADIKTMLDTTGADAVYPIGEKFGTVAARLGEVTIEVTTFRNRDEATPGGGVMAALHTDLAHRDFTVNAIAQDLLTGETHDPYGGELDMRHHLIRAVGSPEERFREDPLRLLRTVRLSTTLGFFIDRDTRQAVRELAPLLEGTARERVGDELDRLLLAEQPSEGISLLDNLGLLPYTVPELLEMHEMERGPLHYKEVYPHTLKVLDRTPLDLILRWAGLLHDIAKPATYGITDGEVHFFGHEKLGSAMARRILTRLRRPQEVVEQVEQLVLEHLRIGLYDESWSDGAVRRFLRETAPITERLFALSRADITSQRPHRVAAALARIEALYSRCEEIEAQEEVEKLHSPLNGDELMQIFGGRPGPWIGRVKDYLLELVLDGALSQEDKEVGERLARAFIGEHPELAP